MQNQYNQRGIYGGRASFGNKGGGYGGGVPFVNPGNGYGEGGSFDDEIIEILTNNELGFSQFIQ